MVATVARPMRPPEGFAAGTAIIDVALPGEATLLRAHKINFADVPANGAKKATEHKALVADHGGRGELSAA
jgi:hypothetical protein